MTRPVEPFLGEVNGLLLRMAGCCEAILAKALRALFARDPELAEQVRGDDLEIDRLDVALDEAVLRSLALQAPVADDLRRVLAAKDIATDLERVDRLVQHRLTLRRKRLEVRRQRDRRAPASCSPTTTASTTTRTA